MEQDIDDLTILEPEHGRFCVSDSDFMYYTRFPSKESFRIFWNTIQPSDDKLEYWYKAQDMAVAAVRQAPFIDGQELPVIDEFFMYCYLTAAGMELKVLASIFSVSLPHVIRIVTTWANYLYILLGSIPIWMTKDQVWATMPPKVLKTYHKVRVILGCTEVRCEGPNASTLASEASSDSTVSTFKGLLGVSPSGTVTFVSMLHTGPISDAEMTRQSGVVELLEEGDEVMADDVFSIESLLSTVGAKPFSPQTDPKCRIPGPHKHALEILRQRFDRVFVQIRDFKIFNNPIPLSLAGSINQIWMNCCLLLKYQEAGEQIGEKHTKGPLLYPARNGHDYSTTSTT